MKKLLEYLVSSIVNYPKDISVTEKEENKYFNLIIKVHPNDLKIIIGKNGQTIKAIRELVKIKAILKRKNINIAIEE